MVAMEFGHKGQITMELSGYIEYVEELKADWLRELVLVFRMSCRIKGKEIEW